MTACSSDGDGGAAATGDTRTFTYRDVSVDIPTDPQRVVCIETRLCPEFAEITGMNLVATPDLDGDSSIVYDKLPDSVELFHFHAAQPEALATFDPDLVMTTSAWFDTYDSEVQERLEGIAPVLPLAGDIEDTRGEDWLQILTDQADQLGKRAEAEQSIDEYKATVDEVSKVVGADGKTAAAVVLSDDQFGIIDDSLSNKVLEDLGFTLLTRSDSVEADGSVHMYSKENLSILQDADVIFVQNPDEAMHDDVLWKKLPAVAAGKAPALSYYHRSGLTIAGANFAEYVAEQLG